MDPASAPPAETEATPEEAIGLAFKAAVVKVLDDTSLDLGGKMGKIKAILKGQESAMAALGGDKKAEEAPAEEPAATESKTEEAPAAEVTRLQEQVTRLTAELEARVALESAGIKCGAATLKAFSALTSEADQTAFIAEHKTQPISGSRPKSTDQWAGSQGSEQVTEAKNGKEFADLLRRGSRPMFGRSA